MIVNVKIVERGEFIFVKEVDAFNYNPYTQDWMHLSELKPFWHGKLPHMVMADHQRYIKELFATMSDVCYIFIGYDRTNGALIISKKLVFEGTTQEEW